ncbi:MAG: hypothetical protein B7X44_05965 [Halothiobacillus sp. 15-55-196]|jgi:uncharacterized membrane protein (DUF4010 family)|uniref:MgtC/SapB family protein n=1 Tax=Halothiobacillus sp. 15-55-196 TaxID=1970382 RepID=UPI000BDAA96E|nr:MgtC/SapB family protein [Halothiobacillus sp. 15-55-196]OZB36420.1 MAG: hypothetical protein B7X44_05965 [Halothiobacillus sp. 15-55-196]OZB77680.1 MAG: hypothetical protein B7X29_07670 [Halothiobacillus sp. 13-55-115]
MNLPVDDPLVLLQNLGVALGIGLLIGLERGWHERGAEDGRRIAGVRTFGLIGLTGGLTGILSAHFGVWVLVASLLGLSAILVASYWAANRQDNGLGITTEVASLLTLILGAAAVAGYTYTAVVSAVVITILLGMKAILHRGLLKLSEAELFAIFKLLLIALVILPVLPNGNFGPWGALNPFVIGWMILLLAGLSFVGYFAMRILGSQRGLLLTSVFGGLVSSTALTLVFSRLARGGTGVTAVLAIGIVIASVTLLPRVVIEVGIVNPALASELIPVLGGMLLVGFGGALLWWRYGIHPQNKGMDVAPVLKNPLELTAALRFGLLLVSIMLFARAIQYMAGDAGIYALAAISGLADVDALSLSLAKMAADAQVAPSVATEAIVLAIFVNTMVKTALAYVIGGKALGLRVASVLLPTVAVGGVLTLY